MYMCVSIYLSIYLSLSVSLYIYIYISKLMENATGVKDVAPLPRYASDVLHTRQHAGCAHIYIYIYIYTYTYARTPGGKVHTWI